MQALRSILSDKVSTAAIAMIAGCLLLFQAITGNAAEIARAGGAAGAIVLCSASPGKASENGTGHSGTLCAECCTVCHLSHAVALAPSGRFVAVPVRLVASRAVPRPSTRAPPRPAPRARSTLSRGPPSLS